MSTRLEDVIRRYVTLPTQPASTGFYPVRCQVCDDHAWKIRAGFLFVDDAVYYNCFNCKHKTRYDPKQDNRLPQKMLKVMEAFGIPKEEWQAILLVGLANEDEQQTKPKKETKVVMPKEIPLPPHFYRVGSRNDEWSLVVSEYLREVRGIDSNDYPFYLSDHKQWKARLIIPVYRGETLIFYQGRDLTDKASSKYKSPSSSSNILYGFDELYKNTDLPLYVMEGFFDGYVVGGAAVFGNEFSKQQLKHLHRSRRQKVIVPDQKGDGHLLAEQALEEGWAISCPDIGGCKDTSEAVMKYGRLYVMKSLAENTVTGFAAKLRLETYCDKKNNTSTSKKKG